MTVNKNYGYIKKRILDAIDEVACTNEVFVSDGNRQVLLSRMPDALNASLVRMYESLPIGTKRVLFHVNKFKNIAQKDADGSYFFSANGNNIVITCGIFGTGKIYVSDGIDTCEFQCNGTSSLSFVRHSVNTQKGKNYTITSDQGLTIQSLAVYEIGTQQDLDAFAPDGFCSVCLPDNFDSFLSVNGRELSEKNAVNVCGSYAYFPVGECESNSVINAVYAKKPPVISESTEDSFEFDLSSLGIEALINLSASELCRENEAAMYSRLFYKYCDLAEGLHSSCVKSRRENRFYRDLSKRRW